MLEINFLTKMSAKELKAIADIGIALGYSGDELKQFVNDERMRMDKEKELDRHRKEAEAEKERQRKEAEAEKQREGDLTPCPTMAGYGPALSRWRRRVSPFMAPTVRINI